MAITKIRKRDGSIVDFDKKKIADAIFKSAQEIGGKDYELSKKITEDVCILLDQRLKPSEVPTVEQVQDAVEKVLVENGHYRTSKAYILHRALHNQIRDLVDSYLSEESWLVRENANMSYSLQGLNFHISSDVISQYWLHKIYKPNRRIREAHVGGDFHIHDLQLLGAYCVGWDLHDLLASGFTGVRGKVSCRPAKHFGSALGQIINFFFTLQGEAAGAQAFSSMDTYLAPFIDKDGLSYDQVKQELQAFAYNINVPTRVGFQTPFTNLTFDLTVPKFMQNERVMLGGKQIKDTYGGYQEEMDMFNKAFAEVMIEGDAMSRVFTFPIPTINITKDFDWDSEVNMKIMESSAKYGIPYFANFVNSNMDPEDVRSMCCHLRLDKRELKTRGGGLFGANPLTGSIGVVTINMPRLGYLAKDETEFFERLGNVMELAKQSLEIKRDMIEKFTDRGLYPYSKFYLRNIKEGYGKYWKNHFSTIGLIGMNEACINFMDKTIGSPEGLKFAERTLDFMRNRLQDYQETTGNIYNLEATPAEGTSYRLARIDKKIFPDIAVANNGATNQGAKPFYTNSTNLPVNFTDDLFEALQLQDSLQTKYTGGTVMHIYLGESMPPVESVSALVKKVCSKFELPYFTLTPTFSICPNHGYMAGQHKTCPRCKDEGKQTNCEVYSRVVGYLRPVDQWNEGKQEEFKLRAVYDKALA
jgi:ribonucleoside-triphosphate reductase